MNLDFITIFNSLDFLSESIRLQYTNFIFKNQNLSKLTFEEVIKRIKNNEPIEYILNTAEFFGNKFFIDQRCLIPRPETEEIVEKTINFINSSKENDFTIIDIGTGSGCIILSIAKYFNNINKKNIKLIGLDISKDALEVASINRKEFRLESYVELINCDFQDFDFAQYKNLIICSNLPYIPNNHKSILQKSVINYEPHLALFGGENGDELNKILIEKVKNQNVHLFLMEGLNGVIEEISF